MLTCWGTTYRSIASILVCSLLSSCCHTNITCVVTIQAKRRGIAVKIKQFDKREPLLYKCFWETVDNKVLLHSFAANTKSSGKRNVLLLTTMQPILGTTKDDGKKKPVVSKLYDYTKGHTNLMY